MYIALSHHQIREINSKLTQKRRRACLSVDIQLISKHGLRSTSNRTLAVPRTCNSFGDRSFAAEEQYQLWTVQATSEITCIFLF